MLHLPFKVHFGPASLTEWPWLCRPTSTLSGPVDLQRNGGSEQAEVTQSPVSRSFLPAFEVGREGDWLAGGLDGLRGGAGSAVERAPR